MNFVEQCASLSENEMVKNYFVDTDTTLVDFLTTYIQIDKILKARGVSVTNSEMVSKLESLDKSLDKNYQLIQVQYESLREKVSALQNPEHFQQILEKWNKDTSNSNVSQLKEVLQNLKSELVLVNEGVVGKVDKKLLELINSIQINLNSCLESSSVNGKVSNIEQVLNNLYSNFTHNSSKKGEYAENILSSKLPEAFPECEIIDTHAENNSGDFHIIREGLPKILIESKNFSGNVPKRDIDKFYKDIQLNNCCGILCNTFGGIANKQNFEIDIVDDHVLIFVHNYQFDMTQLKLAANVIYNTHKLITEHLQLDSISVSPDFFSSLKLEYDSFLRSFHHHLSLIKTSVNSLSDLHFTLINDFFTRKSRKQTVKPPQFMCEECSKSFASKWSLTRHVKDQHPQSISQPKPNNRISF
jgi:hypothetical protein